MEEKDLIELGREYLELKEKKAKEKKRLKTYNPKYYKNRREQILAKAKEKYTTDPEYLKKVLENNKKSYNKKMLAKKATMKDTMNILKHTKNIITLGSTICKLTDDEIKSIYDGFHKFRDYDDLTIHYLSLCNIDSEGENHGVVGYQIQIEKYAQAVAKLINQKKLDGGKFLEALEVLVLFCKKYKIDTVEILVRN